MLFSYNSYVKFHVSKIELYPYPCYSEVCYKWTALYIFISNLRNLVFGGKLNSKTHRETFIDDSQT